MQFSHPSVFLLLFLVPVLLIGAILAARARGEGWKRLVGPRLRHALVQEGVRYRRWVSLAFGLLAFALLIVTLTIPHAGHREEKEIVRGRNILLAIDVSRSMLAKDESPNRLTAARAAALEVLELFPSDRIGLIAFSGGPWLHAPLTIDHGALVETLQQLDAETLPRGGSDLSEAVKLAVDTLKETGQQNNALIIFSDGEAHDGDIERAAERAEEAELTIFTIGFGTEEGSFIPDARRKGERVRDRSGNLVFTRLKSKDLQLLASRTGGFYTQGSGKQLSRSLEAAVERMDRSESEGATRRTPIHRFQWFLLPAMILLILSLLTNTPWRLCRPGAVALLALLLVPPSLEARVLPATAAEKALGDKDYERALKLFGEETAEARGERLSRLSLGEGAAAYHSGRYSRALKSYATALLSRDPAVQTEAHYALGNSLYQQGLSFLQNADGKDTANAIKNTLSHLEDALTHYDGALALAKDHPHAQANRDQVEKIIEALKQQQEQQEQEREEGGPEEPQESPPENSEGEADSENQQDQPQGSEGQEETGEEGDRDQEGEGSSEDQSEQNPPPESGESQADPASANNDPENSTEALQQPASPAEDTGETPEERARRILAENADFQTTPLAQRHLKQPRTDKDW